jgi:hypothetical protein
LAPASEFSLHRKGQQPKSYHVTDATPLPTHVETIYIAPGRVQCRVYAIPHGLRPNQAPRDLAPPFQDLWREIGLLNHRLELVCLEPAYADLADDIAGLMGGTYFQTTRPGEAPTLPQVALSPP